MKTKLIPKSPPPTEAGFTIIESLLAVIVVGILIVAIGPVIALSAATRIQARRVEWATQASRAYLDGLRAKTIDPPKIKAVKPDSAQKYVDLLNDVSAYTPGNLGGTECKSREYCLNDQFYCFDGDKDGFCTNDSLKDFLIQAEGVQNEKITVKDEADRYLKGYLVGIRVYRADGFKADGSLKKTEKNQVSAQDDTFGGGMGDRKAPVLETISSIIGSESSYNDLCSQTNFGTNPCSE